MSPCFGHEPVLTPAPPPRDAPELPRGDDWLFELAWEGERVALHVQQDAVRLSGRDGRDLTNRFPRLAAAAARLRSAAVIEGEIVLLERYSGAAVRFLAGVAAQENLLEHRMALLATDMLALDGVDLRPQPFSTRRAKLAALGQRASTIVVLELQRSPEAAIATARHLELRGVVARRRNAPYRPNVAIPDAVKVRLTSLGDDSRPDDPSRRRAA